MRPIPLNWVGLLDCARLASLQLSQLQVPGAASIPGVNVKPKTLIFEAYTLPQGP